MDHRKLWTSGRFYKQGISPTYGISPNVPWTPYESYMEAQILQGEPFQLGILIVKFPANVSEDNELHCHPLSDRTVTVIEGAGTFEYCIRQELFTVSLVPGDRVWMPRGILHTFRSGMNGLLVESLHHPFIPFNHPHCLVYPRCKGD